MKDEPGVNELERLRDRIAKLERINEALMDRVERTVDTAGDAYALFEANITMKHVIRERTQELARANETLQIEVGERRRAEEEMRLARDHAEAANNAKSQFLANMSHEIRTPITAIIGFAQIIRPHVETNQEALDAADTISRNGDHLIAVINDILDLSKLEAEEFEIETRDTETTKIFKDTLGLLGTKADENNTRIELRIADDIPRHITTDPVRFRQILINVVGNAIKFTRDGTVKIDVNHNAGQMTIVVEDTGIGMSEQTRAAIFNPFFQADSSMSRRFGGTGLGLSIALRFANLLGGSIDCDSALGVGTAFTITLPIEESHEPVTPEAHPRTLHRAQLDERRVLLVEDGPDNQRLIEHLLRRCGCQCHLAQHGAEAIDAVDNAPRQFDAILMDMQMPVMDGYAATKSMRRRGVTIPIIALTAHAMSGDRQRCLDAGCDDYLTKPIDSDQLRAVLAKHIAKDQDAARAA